MNKNKQSTDTLPKNIQITFIATVAGAFVVNTIYGILLLMRIYPHGLRPSQFTFIMFTSMLLPVVLFACAYLIAKRRLPRFAHLFYAAVVTVIGYFLFRLVSVADRALSLHSSIYQSEPFLNGGMIALPLVVTLLLYAGLLYSFWRRNQYTGDTPQLQRTMISVGVLTYAVDAVYSLSDLVSRHIGSKNIMNLLTHQDFLTTVVIPVVCFVIAYSVVRNANRLNRLFTAMLYATTGVIVTLIIQLLSNYSLPAFYMAAASFSFYILLVMAHNWESIFNKKK